MQYLRREIHWQGVRHILSAANLKRGLMGRRRKFADRSEVRVILSSGGEILCTFQGNLFDLTENERALVTVLTNAIQKHKKLPEEATDAARV